MMNSRYYRTIENFLDIERARTRYEITSRIVKNNPHPVGQGSRGDVYEAHMSGYKVAVKVMRGTPEEAWLVKKRIVRELAVWSRLNHDNVAKFYGLAYDPTFGPLPGIVSAFVEFDLMAYTSTFPGSRLKLICEILLGVKYLHGEFVIHGDLKPDNVRVSTSGCAKIIDFGMGKIEGVHGFTTVWSPNPRYVAPELLLSEDGESVRPTFRSDIYSVAMLILQVLHGRDRHPETHWDSSVPYNEFNHTSIFNLCVAVQHGRRPRRERYRNITLQQWGLLERCWRKEPHERPHITEVIEVVRFWD